MTDPQQGETPEIPRWTTSWPMWFGIFGNVTVVPASDYDDLERRLREAQRELAASRSAALEEAAQNLDNFQAHVDDDWLHQRKTDSGPAACARLTRALKSTAPQVNRPGEPSGNRAGTGADTGPAESVSCVVPRDVLQDIARQFRDASDDIAHWGDYAGEYFKKKYHYEDDIKRYRDQENKVRAMLSAAPLKGRPNDRR